ncbi:chloramphenicol 3-O phosphotransferase [Actinacidiphila yanglinensis]|uniref:Chloramphenicol 3-O phosphotransferase n=1 Tax=Actinacidiphila yanglinensis TaxID=310779 RepID=A0A1H6EE52_9ACTN|nr:AAA family ATPase [Actinacidiphila yanglinensis]SEG96042.1 chloramphenicol 3-O phosphotransferase [Actinacidiphila yanglinensis]
MRPGRIIFLNGTSSSGKSCLARELLAILDGDPWFHVPVDGINAMRAGREIAPDAIDGVLTRTRMGFHRAVAGMAAAGNDLVVDHVLSEPWRLDDCLTVLAGVEVFLIGVHCPLPELKRREGARSDRPQGLAAYQYTRVHTHGLYDFECDTGTASPRACAELVKEYVESRIACGRPPVAFRRLRAARDARAARAACEAPGPGCAPGPLPGRTVHAAEPAAGPR